MERRLAERGRPPARPRGNLTGGVRTLAYVAISRSRSACSSATPSPTTSRGSPGGRRALLLILVIAPLWINYLMRMLAWVNLLAPDGYVNRFLTYTHL